jgi:hypothetical protein
MLVTFLVAGFDAKGCYEIEEGTIQYEQYTEFLNKGCDPDLICFFITKDKNGKNVVNIGSNDPKCN